MSMTKPTPGPWIAYEDARSSVTWVDAGRLCIAECPPGEDGQKMFANARLIAAAPDLLGALQKMLREFGYDVVHPNGLIHDEHEAILSAIAAIAKATGDKP